MSLQNTFSGFEGLLILVGFILIFGGIQINSQYNPVFFLGGIGFLFWAGYRLKIKSDNENRTQNKLMNLSTIKSELDQISPSIIHADTKMKKTKISKEILGILAKINKISKDIGDLINEK